jgi:hypothetical protein
MKCQSEKCQNLATCGVAWPGQKQLGMCEACVGKAHGVARAMGFELTIWQIEPRAHRFHVVGTIDPLATITGFSELIPMRLVPTEVFRVYEFIRKNRLPDEPGVFDILLDLFPKDRARIEEVICTIGAYELTKEDDGDGEFDWSQFLD